MANLFGNATPDSPDLDAGPPGITTGTRIRVTAKGTITFVRWRAPNTPPSGPVQWFVVAYNPATDGPAGSLGNGVFPSIIGGTVNVAPCSIHLNAGDEFVVEVWNADGRYVASSGVFASDLVSGPLVGPADDAVFPRHNGRFNIGGAPAFPADGFARNAYHVDVEFVPDGISAAGAIAPAGTLTRKVMRAVGGLIGPAGVASVGAPSIGGSLAVSATTAALKPAASTSSRAAAATSSLRIRRTNP